MRNHNLEYQLNDEHNLVSFVSMTKDHNLSFVVYGKQEDIDKLEKLIFLNIKYKEEIEEFIKGLEQRAM